MKKILNRISKLLTYISLQQPYFKDGIDLNKYSKKYNKQENKSLDLGSGFNPRNPFNASSTYGIDIRHSIENKNIKKCILGFEKIPFEDEYFDFITAYDLLEHIPRTSFSNNSLNFPFVFLMNEIWRVLKVGGLFFSSSPCYPMKEAFQDPTHVNIMTEDTLNLYFAEKKWASIYGFNGSFNFVLGRWKSTHYECLLKKIKN